MSATASRRLTTIEDALPVGPAIRLWLAEAHAFESLDAYVEWLTEQPFAHAPLVRIPAQVEASVRAEGRGRDKRALNAAIRSEVRTAVYLVQLVIQANVALVEQVHEDWFRLALLTSRRRVLELEEEVAHLRRHGSDARRLEREATWTQDAQALADHLAACVAGVEKLADEDLAGTNPLFPVLKAEITELRATLERVRAPASDAATPTPTAISEFAAGIIAWARATALDALGETREGVRVMEAHWASRRTPATH